MKTTKKDFNLFCKECLRWQEILGLSGFELRFVHGNAMSDKIYGNCMVDVTARTALIRLCKDWPEAKSFGIHLCDQEIRLTAFHEICHVWLDLLSSCARARYIYAHEIEEAEHDIIRTLEKVLYPHY